MQVVIGRLGRAHGIRGDLTVELRTDEPEKRFAPGSSVLCDSAQLVVKSLRKQSNRWIVRFEGVVDRTAAEKLSGQLLQTTIDPTELPDDDESFYDHQLVGLAVRVAGEIVGRVTDVEHLPGHDSLVIETASGVVQVPFVQELVPEVDLGEQLVEVAQVQGLLDLDEADVAADEVPK